MDGLTGRPRPAFLRALGVADPPLEIQVDGENFYRAEIYKHDSWAATARYASASKQIVCKFNRQAPIFLVPMAWLGRFLAAHERKLLERLADSNHTPRCAGAVTVGQRLLSNALARSYVAGHPLGKSERVNDRFFPALEQLLTTMHARGMAYVDLHKHENIIVGDDGRPYLVDFQISLALGQATMRNVPFAGRLLRLFQESDRYHLRKHIARCRPDLAAFSESELAALRPWWIRLHRLVAVPLRALRRAFLVLVGVRTGKGRATSEHFAEDAVRRETEPLRQAA